MLKINKVTVHRRVQSVNEFMELKGFAPFDKMRQDSKAIEVCRPYRQR